MIWGGFVGQFRLAGVAVLTIVVLGLIVHEVAPFAVDHVGTEAYRRARDNDYVGHSRRVHQTRLRDRLDGARLGARVSDARRGAAVDSGVGWAGAQPRHRRQPRARRRERRGRVANVAAGTRRQRRERAAARRVAARTVDGRPRARRGRRRARRADARRRVRPRRRPTTARSTSRSCSRARRRSRSSPIRSRTRPASPLDSFLARLTAAWSLQNVRILSRDIAQPHPTLITHRDIRDRLHRYAPFFFQGRRVAPLLVGDSLYWTVDLYSASSTIRSAAACRSAPTNSATSATPRPRWCRRRPATSFSCATRCSIRSRRRGCTCCRRCSRRGSRCRRDCARLVGPPLDGLLAQSDVVRLVRARTAASGVAFPLLNGADSALAGDELPIALRGGSTTAVALPLVDDNDRLRGLIVGIGGASDSMAWYPLATAGPRWGAVLDRLRSVDSAGSAARDGPRRATDACASSRCDRASRSCSRRIAGVHRTRRRSAESRCCPTTRRARWRRRSGSCRPCPRCPRRRRPK